MKYRFHVLDYDRSNHPEYGNSYEVMCHNFIEPLVAETGEWITLPTRSSLDVSGPSFEIGPYSLDPDDVVTLYNSLVSHMRIFSDDCTRNP